MRIDKDFLEIVFRADGGDFGSRLFEDVLKKHNRTSEKIVKEHLRVVKKHYDKIDKFFYDELESHIIANYSMYVEEGYKEGFNDAISYVVSLGDNG